MSKIFKRNSFDSIELQYQNIAQYQQQIEQEQLEIIRKELGNSKLKYVQKMENDILLKLEIINVINYQKYLMIKITF